MSKCHTCSSLSLRPPTFQCTTLKNQNGPTNEAAPSNLNLMSLLSLFLLIQIAENGRAIWKNET